MIIGINALFQARGASLVNLTQLIQEWGETGILHEHKFIIFASPSTSHKLNEVLSSLLINVEVVILNRADHGLFTRLIVEQIELPYHLKKYNVDVLFCPANTMPFTTNIPCVTTFQNAAPFCPSISMTSIEKRYWIRFKILGLFMRMSAIKSIHIIFISRFFRDLFVNQFQFPVEKSTVIYRAKYNVQQNISTNPEIEHKYGIQRPYILMVSHLYPYKNVTQLIEGHFMALQKNGFHNVQLVITGEMPLVRYHTRVQDVLHKLRVGKDQVLLTGGIPHEEIGHLLSGCSFFVFSSTCENCPVSLIEAMSLGVPIACSNVGVMPETAGDAAIYFDPYNSYDIGNVLHLLFTQPTLQQELRLRSLQQAQQFPSQEEVAQKTFQVIERATNL